MALLGQLSIKGRALRLLGTREHSRAELERKLAAHEQEPGQLRQALDELQAKGLISEERVAESVIHRRAARMGTARIHQELKGKGLSADLMASTLQQLRTTELDRATEVWRKKFGAVPTNPAERARQMRFLASRGFGAEVVARVLAGGVDGD